MQNKDIQCWSRVRNILFWHYHDVIMSAMASQITSLMIVYSTIYSGADERKHQSSASLAFVRGIHRWPVNSPYQWPVTRKCFHLMTSSWGYKYGAFFVADIILCILGNIKCLYKVIWGKLSCLIQIWRIRQCLHCRARNHFHYILGIKMPRCCSASSERSYQRSQ